MLKCWWLGDENGKGNFGDFLTPSILEYFNIKYSYINNFKEADAICVGSIARRAMPGGLVLGSGIISEFDRLNANAEWKFVRGPLTRKRVLECNGNCSEIYGDPALLLPLIHNPKIAKINDIGYIPHLVDYDIIKKTYTESIHLRTSNYKEVVDKILKYKKVISSSLHGIIVAHAYGIPAAWANTFNGLKGDDIKFKDYFLSVGITNYVKSTYNNPVFIEPGSIDLTPIIQIFENEVTKK